MNLPRDNADWTENGAQNGQILVRNCLRIWLLLHSTTHEFLCHPDVQKNVVMFSSYVKRVSHVLPRLLTVMFAVFVYSYMDTMHDNEH